MSFVSLNNLKIDNKKENIILFNLESKELNSVKNLCKIIGIKDIIIINSANAETKLVDILENNVLVGNTEIIKEKAIIFSNVESKKITFILDGLKKTRIKNLYKATITETSKNWNVRTLIKNLIEEEISLKTSKELIH